ncbi:NUDIX domain-containing protein [Bacteriovoracaceae bacterium]|nr:NUDIX domain-containing protein [Bacteriovoracaceae bacterium]
MNIYTLEDLNQHYSELIHDNVWKYAIATVLIDNEILLILRSDQMPTHSGQVGMFGGARKKGESFLETAKREFEEETSISAQDLEFLGYGKPSQTRGRKVTIPVIFEIKQYNLDTFMKNVKSNGEWVETFSIPIPEFKNNDNWGYSNYHRNGQSFQFYFFDHSKTLFGQSQRGKSSKALLWGMTANVVYNLFRIT